MSDENGLIGSKVLAGRDKIFRNRQMIEKLTEDVEIATKELQSICRHELIIRTPGHFDLYDPVIDYDATEPELKTCIVCGFRELGTEITVAGKRSWYFRVLVSKPLAKTNRVVTIAEQEMMRDLKDILHFPLPEVIKRLEKIGYKVF